MVPCRYDCYPEKGAPLSSWLQVRFRVEIRCRLNTENCQFKMVTVGRPFNLTLMLVGKEALRFQVLE